MTPVQKLARKVLSLQIFTQQIQIYKQLISNFVNNKALINELRDTLFSINYLTELHSGDILFALLIPYDKSQIMRIVAFLIDLYCDIFVRVAARNTVARMHIEI